MAKGTRFYEVAVPAKDAGSVPAEERVYLVEAETPSAAEKTVARFYIGEAKLVDAKRAVELVSKPTTVQLKAEGVE